MCIGQPLLILEKNGIAARAANGDLEELIDLSLTPEAAPGDWVLSFLGAAREVISADEAAKISAALDGLRAVLQGQGPGTAFADLETEGPKLPPHLEAARAAGRDIA